MADATADMDAEHAASLRRRYLIQFEEDTLRPRPLWIRLIIEFLGTLVLVTVAAGSGVINHYVGGGPISTRPRAEVHGPGPACSGIDSAGEQRDRCRRADSSAGYRRRAGTHRRRVRVSKQQGGPLRHPAGVTPAGTRSY